MLSARGGRSSWYIQQDSGCALPALCTRAAFCIILTTLKPDKASIQPAGLYKTCFLLETFIVLWHAPGYFCVQLQNSAWKLKDPILCVLGEGLDRVWFVAAIHCSCLTLNLSAALPQATIWHPEAWEEGQLQFSVVVTAQSWPLVTHQYRPTCCEGTVLVECLEALVCWMFVVGLTHNCTPLKTSVFLDVFQVFQSHISSQNSVMRNLSIFC